MPTQTLQLTPQLTTDAGIRFSAIVHDFGDGYRTHTLTGNSAGEKFYQFVFSVLPDRSTHTVTDPETSTTETYADYLWNFYVRRMGDGAAFNITDPRTGSTVLVRFVDTELSYNLFQRKCAATGIRLQQVRE